MNHNNRYFKTILAGLAVAAVFIAPAAFAQVAFENLDTWFQESYDVQPNPAPGTSPLWQRNGTSATQQGNTPRPTFLHNTFDVSQHRITAEISVSDTLDNDWLGFVLGFDSGETRTGSPEYLYIDWKKDVDQSNEQSAAAGLAISRVTGFPNIPDFTNHVNTTLSGPANGVEELTRALNLGFIGWQANRVYQFQFDLRPNSLQVWVDGSLEFDLSGNFEAGRFGCMANSQALVTCANVTIEALPDPPATGFVDFAGFTAERYGVLSPSRPIAPLWDVGRDGSPFSVQQRLNADPSVYYSPFTVSEARIAFEVTVATDDDEDQFGFAVGYQPGDNLSAAADFVLVEWKQAPDPANIVALFPATAGFTGGEAGLFASRVTGSPLNIEFVERQSFDNPPYTPGSGLEVLARGSTLGQVGWQNGAVYSFVVELSADRLRVFIDDVLEIDVSGSFEAAPFAFFNASQRDVIYRNLTIEPLG